ncbi:hypothetical protein BSZ35_11920 [Salinibacter sp. 10B]|uniref:hypothetical protein n=1 Tax=Salinibacter sp. 10B TaxID=1923971 RepID=UPI000CF434C8|nr:hypothetical protein [Salinibacter sp. 10B]PQJ35204.1 hypothetical protein BSZ35_11920 [Salinibacter sp. 10B]
MDTFPEHVFLLEGAASFLDVVYETIEAHVRRTGEEYEQVITGIEGADVGDVDHESTAVLYVYALGTVEPEEAKAWIERALDRIADDHNMDLSRAGVQVTREGELEEEEGTNEEV